MLGDEFITGKGLQINMSNPSNTKQTRGMALWRARRFGKIRLAQERRIRMRIRKPVVMQPAAWRDTPKQARSRRSFWAWFVSLFS